MHEADIGSGERSPGQHETDEMIRQIPPRGAGKGTQQDAGQPGNQQATRDGQPSKGCRRAASSRCRMSTSSTHRHRGGAFTLIRFLQPHFIAP